MNFTIHLRYIYSVSITIRKQLTFVYSQEFAGLSNGKIIEIGKADLNDPMTEFLLRMSFKLVEYLKIRDLDLP